MARSSRQPRPKAGEGIVGVRMAAELITELKAEARERRISLGKLIEELWASYRSTWKETETR